MRKKSAFTLIELILSMVIIAIAFTVLPKILQLAAKVSVQNIREEAMYNAVAYIGLIKSTAWDENNTVVDDILHVDAGDNDYECNSSASNPIRQGGFTGSRNCKDDYNASTILEIESNDNYIADDMDDFTDINATNYNSSRDYNLSVTVHYVKDINESNAIFSSVQPSGTNDTTNTKEINVTVNVKKKASALGHSLVKISFTAQNIGQLRINRRSWN